MLNELEASQKEINRLRKELKKKKNIKAQQNNKMSACLNDKNKEISALRKERNSLRKQLESQVKAKKGTWSRKPKENNRLESELAKLKKEKEQLQDKYDELNHDYQQRGELMAKLDRDFGEKYDELQVKLKTAEGDTKERQQSQLKILQTENASLRTRLESKEKSDSKISKKNELLEQKASENKRLNSEIEGLNALLKEKNKIIETQKDYKKIKNDLEQFQSKSAELENQLLFSQEQNANLRGEKAVLEQQLNWKKSEYEAQLSTEQNKKCPNCPQLVAIRQALENDNRNQTNEISSLNRQISEL